MGAKQILMLDQKLTSRASARAAGIGFKTAEKVDGKSATAEAVVFSPHNLCSSSVEILRTGTLQRLEELRRNPKVKVLELFGKVFKTGPEKALKYYEKGHRTLEDLAYVLLSVSVTSHVANQYQPCIQRCSADPGLDKHQRLGIKYYEELNSKMPRSECEEIEAMVRRYERS